MMTFPIYGKINNGNQTTNQNISFGDVKQIPRKNRNIHPKPCSACGTSSVRRSDRLPVSLSTSFLPRCSMYGIFTYIETPKMAQ